MNVLSLAEQAQIVGALTEGIGIRAASRLYGHSRGTVNNLALNAGLGCLKLHDVMMVGLRCQRIEVDEIHSFVGSKKATHPHRGAQYTFIALCGASRAIISFLVGKRTTDTTHAFLTDARKRVVGRPEINSDCFMSYLPALKSACGDTIEYGRITKNFGRMQTAQILGRQDLISTQRVERQNLTLRQTQKRFGRRSTGHSKTLRHHVAAVALYTFNYNFCRVHRALKMTPAMQLGIADHAWSISELVSAALHGEIADPIDVERVTPDPEMISAPREPDDAPEEQEADMALDAATLRRLAALSLPTEAFQEVLSILADVQANEEKRRTKARDRTSRWRHGDVSVTSPERHGNSDIPPVHIPSPQGREKEPKKVLSISIDPDLKISETNLEFALSKGWTEPRARSEFDRFRDHFVASGARKRDWAATWRNWVTSPFQTTPKTQHSGFPPRPGSKEDNREKTHAAIQELRGYIDAHADDARGGGDPGGSNAGLLPFVKPARS